MAVAEKLRWLYHYGCTITSVLVCLWRNRLLKKQTAPFSCETEEGENGKPILLCGTDSKFVLTEFCALLLLYIMQVVEKLFSITLFFYKPIPPEFDDVSHKEVVEYFRSPKLAGKFRRFLPLPWNVIQTNPQCGCYDSSPGSGSGVGFLAFWGFRFRIRIQTFEDPDPPWIRI